jgi:hypothetical protein
MYARACVWGEGERKAQADGGDVCRQTDREQMGSGTYIEASKSPWHVPQTRPNIVPLNPFP